MHKLNFGVVSAINSYSEGEVRHYVKWRSPDYASSYDAFITETGLYRLNSLDTCDQNLPFFPFYLTAAKFFLHPSTSKKKMKYYNFI